MHKPNDLSWIPGTHGERRELDQESGSLTPHTHAMVSVHICKYTHHNNKLDISFNLRKDVRGSRHFSVDDEWVTHLRDMQVVNTVITLLKHVDLKRLRMSSKTLNELSAAEIFTIVRSRLINSLK